MSIKNKLETIVETVYHKNNYILDDEVRKVLLDPSQHKLISAPAGGTKTTMTQLIVNLMKLEFLVEGSRANLNITDVRERVATVISSRRILCLVYNKHNANDIDTVHAKFYNMLVHLKLISPDPSKRNFVEPGVHATTLHAYANEIIKENLQLLKLRDFSLTKDEITRAQFFSVVVKEMKESSIEVTPHLVSQIKSLYDLYVGLQLYKTDLDTPLTDSVQFELALQGTQVPSKYLRLIFEAYDKRKKVLRLHEFSDMLRIADTLMDIPEVLERYKNYFDIIVADEVQDFTPLMFSLYSHLVGPNTKTITVGDSDQSIYSFMGAIENAINNFKDIMGFEPKRFDLSVNRRCRRQTMNYALNIIEQVANRDKRDIVTTKTGGELNRIEYKSADEMIKAVDQLLHKNSVGNTAVLFRNKNQSIILSRYLYVKKIPVNYINAYNCMEHRLYTLFIEAVNECFILKTQRGLRILNRLLPFSKKKLEEFFQFDEKTGISKTCPQAEKWASLDLTPLYQDSRNHFSIHKQVEFIQDVALKANTITASDCVGQLLDMFYHNYFAYLPETDEDPYVELILEWAKGDLSVGYNLQTALINLDRDIRKYMNQSRVVGKLNICTIHGTKGLEFNHVILNAEKEKVRAGIVLSERARRFQEDEERRLMYVGATRQIDSLTILCNMENVHPLSDPDLFKREEPTIIEAKFSQEKPVILEDTLAAKATVRRPRRSLLLED